MVLVNSTPLGTLHFEVNISPSDVMCRPSRLFSYFSMPAQILGMFSGFTWSKAVLPHSKAIQELFIRDNTHDIDVSCFLKGFSKQRASHKIHRVPITSRR